MDILRGLLALIGFATITTGLLMSLISLWPKANRQVLGSIALKSWGLFSIIFIIVTYNEIYQSIVISDAWHNQQYPNTLIDDVLGFYLAFLYPFLGILSNVIIYYVKPSFRVIINIIALVALPLFIAAGFASMIFFPGPDLQ